MAEGNLIDSADICLSDLEGATIIFGATGDNPRSVTLSTDDPECGEEMNLNLFYLRDGKWKTK